MNIYEFIVCIDHGASGDWCEEGVIFAEDFTVAYNRLKDFYLADNIEIEKISAVCAGNVYITDGWEKK